MNAISLESFLQRMWRAFASAVNVGGVLNDGSVGLLSRGGTSLFDNVILRGNDPAAADGF